jgi:nitrite reductase/ring-hydroxylating ferredoxin subunit
VSCEKDEILPPPPPGSNVAIKLSDYPSLLNVGGMAKVSITKPTSMMFIVKRESEKEFLIFEALCPHQGEELIPDPDKTGKKIFCPRHTVDFSAEKNNKGTVVNNPQGVRVDSLKSDYNYEYDDVSKTLKILL